MVVFCFWIYCRQQACPLLRRGLQEWFAGCFLAGLIQGSNASVKYLLIFFFVRCHLPLSSSNSHLLTELRAYTRWAGFPQQMHYRLKMRSFLKVLFFPCWKSCNYSVPKVALRYSAFKTLFPFLIVVSITDLRMANMFALSSVLNWPDIFCFTLIFLMALSEPLLSGVTFDWS